MTEKFVKLGDCVDLIRDNIDPKSISKAPYIGLEHIEECTLHLNGFGYSTEIDSTKLRFKKGDILFGKLRPYFRKVTIAPFDGICSTDIWVVRAKEGYDQKYIFYWMAGNDFVDFSMSGSEGTKMPRAKWEHVVKFERPYLDFPQQKKIGEVLSAFDDKIELNRQMNQTLEAMARAMFKSWFVDFDPVYAKMEGRDYPLPPEIMDLFPDELEESELGLIPKGWRVEKLGDEFEFAYGKSLPENKRINGPYKVYGSNGEVGWHNEKLVDGPGIVIGRKGNPGIATYVADDFYPIDTTFYIKTDLPCIFSYYLLKNLKLKRLSADSAVPGLNRNISYLENVLIPPTSLLKNFEMILFPLFEKINLSNIENITLQDLRELLLPKLLSGEIEM
jgi:type I restriction enzyme S subunit